MFTYTSPVVGCFQVWPGFPTGSSSLCCARFLSIEVGGGLHPACSRAAVSTASYVFAFFHLGGITDLIPVRTSSEMARCDSSLRIQTFFGLREVAASRERRSDELVIFSEVDFFIFCGGFKNARNAFFFYE